jgi:hypothetical protein
MAIINCPACQKKVSDKAPQCQHCQLDLKNIDETQLRSIKRIQTINKSQQLMNWSFIAMLFFCAGVLVIYWKDLQPGSVSYGAAVTSIVVGVSLYLFARVKMILLKRSLKN